MRQKESQKDEYFLPSYTTAYTTDQFKDIVIDQHFDRSDQILGTDPSLSTRIDSNGPNN